MFIFKLKESEDTKMIKAYIAGKITGNTNYKEQFEKAQSELTDKGYVVMNPSVLNDGFEQLDYLHICMAMIDVCDTVFFLPSWKDSKGSHLEMGYAKGTNKDIKYL